jgi:hypothetical protein
MLPAASRMRRIDRMENGKSGKPMTMVQFFPVRNAGIVPGGTMAI